MSFAETSNAHNILMPDKNHHLKCNFQIQQILKYFFWVGVGIFNRLFLLHYLTKYKCSCAHQKVNKFHVHQCQAQMEIRRLPDIPMWDSRPLIVYSIYRGCVQYLISIRSYRGQLREGFKKKKKQEIFPNQGGGGHPNSLPIILLIL